MADGIASLQVLVFNAKNGELLKSNDTGGALNSGLISDSVDGEPYVAAAVGGATEDPRTVAGPCGSVSTACGATINQGW